jgi:hypothetical protein
MSDDTTHRKPADPAPAGSGRSRSRIGAVRTTLTRRDDRGRPVGVYGIVGIGVATLLVLMLIVYFSSGDGDNPEQPICTTISPEHATDDVRQGKVESLTLAYARQVETPTDEAWGPVQARVDYVDGSCGNLPQGISNQSGLLMILGAIDFYNQTTESAQVKVTYSGLDSLDSSLFVTPTAVPTESPTTVPGTEAPTVPDATPTQLPPSPAASPERPRPTTTPLPTRTPIPTITPTAD